MKRLLPLLAVPAFLLAACSAGTTTTASPTPGATTTTTTGTPSASSGDSGTGTGTGASASTGTGTAQGVSATGTARCHTGDLSAKIGTSEGAAGTYHTNLVFTDKSAHQCTLYGYPGVSWVTGDNGTQVNNPLERDSGIKKTITLSPGGQAHAVLITHAALNFSADKCKPTDVRGYRIYPPDETAAMFVSAPSKECAAKGTNLGQVQPIASGPGEA